MIDISTFGLSDEVVLLLEERAQQRGVNVGVLVRDLIHVGLSHDLAAEQARGNGTDSLMGEWDVGDVGDMLESEEVTESYEAELCL